jgi:hypothetical protein
VRHAGTLAPESPCLPAISRDGTVRVKTKSPDIEIDQEIAFLKFNDKLGLARQLELARIVTTISS